jgi:chromosome segregation ATPase|tara:strand:+ start:954 stop:1391 length:438 start_codon:yes stop_codon:yes gene_type:complete
MAARIYLIIIILGVLGGVGWVAYQYYVGTQTRIAVLTANNAKLETAHQTTVAEFEQYRNTVQKEIEEFKAELQRQQALNDELSDNLQKVQEANRAIAKLLANTDIIKNSLADPKASEERINEQVDLFFGAIGCATGSDCLQSNSN